MHGCDVGIPEGLDYTVSKSVFDAIDPDLLERVMSKRRRDGSDTSQSAQTAKDLEIGQLNLDESSHSRQRLIEHPSTIETQGSTQTLEDRRQLRNMVASLYKT
jgi:hypothetical protein